MSAAVVFRMVGRKMAVTLAEALMTAAPFNKSSCFGGLLFFLTLRYFPCFSREHMLSGVISGPAAA